MSRQNNEGVDAVKLDSCSARFQGFGILVLFSNLPRAVKLHVCRNEGIYDSTLTEYMFISITRVSVLA